MLYDGIAAEIAHVSIDGRATASIIDEKKLPEWAASEAVFCQVSQLGEAGAGHARTQWHASAQHLAASQNGVWWWVITHHQSFKFQTDFDGQKKNMAYVYGLFYAPKAHGTGRCQGLHNNVARLLDVRAA